MNSKQAQKSYFRQKSRIAKLTAYITLFSIVFILQAPLISAKETDKIQPMGVLQADIVPVNPQTEKEKKFYYEIAPGTTIVDQLWIVNVGENVNNISLYPVYGIKNEKDSLSYSDRKKEPQEFSAWISPKKFELTLEPKEQRKLDFTITIPKDTKEGEYFGGFAIEKFFPAKKGEAINTAFRKISSVNIKITNDPKEFNYKVASVFSLPIYFWPVLIFFILSTTTYFVSKYKEKIKK